MANLVIIVEDEPPPALLREMGVELGETLFGLYQGVPLTDRMWDQGNTLPDRILIFQRPHEADAADAGDLLDAVTETLIHEIGHYFGLDEDEIMAIEEQYWRGHDR